MRCSDAHGSGPSYGGDEVRWQQSSATISGAAAGAESSAGEGAFDAVLTVKAQEGPATA